MSRALRVVPASAGTAAPESAARMLELLAEALSGGDAVLPAAPGSAPGAHSDLPLTVEQRIALVVETSGSTARPKRVALSADAVLANAAASQSALGGPGQWVLALPVHYIAGLNVLTRSITAQTAPVVVEGDRFTASGFLAACARLSIPERFVSLVPVQLSTLLDDEGARQELARFRRVLVGGQATPQALLERGRAAGIPIVRSYGSSETAGGCVYDGAPTGTTSVRIVDGEVQLGGPSLAEGYLGDPELTAERFVEEPTGDAGGPVRWFRTADAGRLEGEHLMVTGRRDDVIISGGVKVSLGEVERVVREQPGMTDAVVVRAPHPRWGESPVVVTASSTADDREATARLTERVAAELGVAARPAAVLRVEEMPLLSSGKPDRRALADLARAQSLPRGEADSTA